MPPKSSDPTALIPRQALPAGAGADVVPDTLLREEPPPPEPLAAPWLTTVVWCVPTLLMGALGLINIATPGLWEDELATWGMVTAPWPDFWRVLSHIDAAIGPYYLLLRLWTAIVGDSDVMLRLPSVVAMAVAAGMAACLGIRLSGRRVGLVAGILFATLPMTSRYAQEARPYAFAVFAAVLATLLLLRLLERPRFLRYLAYTGAVALLGLFHAVALLLLVAHAIVVWKQRRRGVWTWLGAAVTGMLPGLPVFYFGQRQASEQIAWIPQVSLLRLAETAEFLFGGAVLAGAVLALALVAMSMRGPTLVATTWAVVPAVGLLVAAYFTPLWLPRYLLFTLPAWVLLGALTLRRHTVLRGVGAVLAIALLGLPLQLDLRGPSGHSQGTRDVAAIMHTHVQPGDVVVYGPTRDGDQRTARDTVMRYVDPTIGLADPLLLVPPRATGLLSGREYEDDQVAQVLGEPERVWMVRKGRFSDARDDLGGAKEELLREDYAVWQTWPLRGLTVTLLVRESAEG